LIFDVEYRFFSGKMALCGAIHEPLALQPGEKSIFVNNAAFPTPGAKP
jgi:hypothetical protein